MLEWTPPYAKWFVGGKLNASVNCVDRHVARAAPQQGGDHLGGRAGRSPHADLLRSLPRGLAVRQRAEGARRRTRRPRGDLHAARSPSWRSRCWPAPASAPCTPWSSAASAPSRCAIASTTRRQGAGHRRRRLPPRQRRAAQADGRRGAGGDAVDRAASSSSGAAPPICASHMQAGRDHWYHELMQDASYVLRARADGRRGHALHPLHVGHDREAEGHRAHDRRLPHRHATPRPSGCSTSRRTTSTGAPPTSAG